MIRRRKKPAISADASVCPLRQGELDGLCGVYAVINAVRLLCPEIDQAIAADLFRTLIRALPKRGGRLMDAIAFGLDVGTVRFLVKTACACTRRELEISLKAKPLRTREKAPRMRCVWKALQTELDTGNVAIIGLSGRLAHWTVAYGMSAKSIRLSDSDDLKVLLRSHCTLQRTGTMCRLQPRDVIVLSRREVRWRGD